MVYLILLKYSKICYTDKYVCFEMRDMKWDSLIHLRKTSSII